jgi:hypothetical protein
MRGSATLRKFLFGSAFAALIWFSIFGFPRAQLTLTSVMPNASSVTAGSPVIWTAAAAGGLGPYRYKFFVGFGASRQEAPVSESRRRAAVSPARVKAAA